MEDLSLYSDEELYEDEEEEAIEEEGPNRTFIILVGSMGGLLAVAICIFAVWAFVISPRMTADRVAQNDAIRATNEALLAETGMVTGTVSLEETATDTPVPVPADTSEPTETAKPPTATPRPATATPAPDMLTGTPEGATEATPAETIEATPAEVAMAGTATPRPTAIQRTTPTPRPGKTGVPETGIGTLGASVLAVGLLFLLIVVRRLRQTV